MSSLLKKLPWLSNNLLKDAPDAQNEEEGEESSKLKVSTKGAAPAGGQGSASGGKSLKFKSFISLAMSLRALAKQSLLFRMRLPRVDKSALAMTCFNCHCEQSEAISRSLISLGTMFRIGLPRADKSALAMTKNLLLFLSIISLVTTTAFAQPTPNEINLYINETKIVLGENIAEYFSLNPQLIEITKTTPYSLEVKALYEGQTFINFWDDEGRKTVKVIISRTPTEKAKTLEAGKTYQTLKGSYSYTWQNTNYNAQNSSSQIFNSIHYLTLNGDTPLGPVTTNLGYEDRNRQIGMSQLTLNVKRDKYQLTLGDSSINFSELTLPYVGLQGAKLTSNHISNLEANFLYGVSGYGWWGVTSRTFLGETRNLTGLSLSYKSDPSTIIKSSIVNVRNKEYGPLDNVYGAEITKSLSGWDLGVEAAKNDTDNSWKLDANYRKDNFSFQGTFRDVGQNFQSAAGGVSYPGVSGLFTNAWYTPTNYLKLSSRIETYKNRLYVSSSNPDYQNLYFNGTLDFNLTPWPHLNVDYFYDDKQGYTGVGVFEGRNIQLSKGFHILLPLSAYLRYYPTRYSNPSDPDEDYVNDSISLGTVLTLTDFLSLNLEKGYSSRSYLIDVDPSTQEKRNYTSDFTNYGLSLSPQLAKLWETSNFSAYATTNWRYEPRSDKYGRSTLSADLTFDYHPFKNGRFYLSSRLIDTKGLSDSTLNLQEISFTFGVNQSFDSGLLWVPRAKVAGYVFNDLDADGIRDENETGIANIKLTLNDKTYITNERGRYWFSGLEGGEIKLELDQKGVPEKFSITNANPLTFTIGHGENKQIDFGIGQRTSVEGFIYNDVNLNKTYDPGIDLPLKGMKAILDGKTKYSDPRGKYIFEQAQVGAHKISLDVLSLPFEYLPFTPTSASFGLLKGEQKGVDFGVKIQRLITGFVFEDKNGNATKDKGEKGFSAVKVFLKDREIETDKDGRFIFKDLAAGAFQLDIDNTTLPFGYINATSLPQEIILLETGENKKEVNIILKAGKKVTPSGLVKGKIYPWARPYNLYPGDKITLLISIPKEVEITKISVYNSDTKKIIMKKADINGKWQIWKGVYKPPKYLPLGKHLLKIFVKAKGYGFDPVYIDYYTHEREEEKITKPLVIPLTEAEAAEEKVVKKPVEKTIEKPKVSVGGELKIELEGIEKIDDQHYNLKLRLNVPIEAEKLKKMIEEAK